MGRSSVPQILSFLSFRSIMSNNLEATQLYQEVLVRIGGIESVYFLDGMNKKQRPVYRRNSDARDFLVRKDNGGYYLVLQKEILHFNQLGQLTATQDFNGCKVRYHYEKRSFNIYF